ncbi:MAG TPA: Zn-dependent hydrolase [Alphaproteobacteria bacterium]|jgi:N-carbamoyl-L-amino-acid hydrolase|nr:Zn-dependent hydrolase [Alphaproteobacteria bacterium]MDP6269231.1 Zn-dependent hydrolase [Alphaproteobacteria bacterium]MDP7163807.1 Zn-dependent hydrolase [Alphaproteobacteria bacterium]MDP7428105.1 Zn-dependent hydrolase [Alphaproteobacteria bacterium]HJM49029.1 Zn-dependent hydrolase [Alphaproteobacteria bacterium]
MAAEQQPGRNIRIDGARLWQSLMDLAAIGATAKGGVCRLALSDEDRAGRDLFVRWCEEAGLDVSVDAMGNIFGRRPGRNPELAPVMAGSHLDSQPTGGKFDGAYGVMAALEVMRTLNDLDYQTEAPLEVAAWTNEEGSRFPAPMIGSAVFAGISELADGLGLEDLEGNKLGDELGRIGYAGQAAVGGRPVGAYFEAHIEQGPILEAEGKTIGVVGGVQGLRWYEITLTGQEAHAGPTPMPSRRDALLGAARIVAAVNRIGHEHLPGACATVGLMQVHPNSRNVIPGRVFLAVDLRHPEAEILGAMGAALQAASEAAAAEGGLELDFAEIHQTPAVVFDPNCVAAVRAGAEAAGYAQLDIISGAGHDACCLAEVAPTGMIFVPCAGGISHNEEESATQADLEAGCNVLLQAMLASA